MTSNAPFSSVSERPVAVIGNLNVEASSFADIASGMVEYCLGEDRANATRPFYSTSANGQVISICARHPEIEKLFLQADSIHADGQPMVMLSRLLAKYPLPERVATTDLFPEVARLAEVSGLSFYLLGATERSNRLAVEEVRKRYPKLRIVGFRNGYFAREDEAAICAEIVAAKPDILWVSLGVPREQEFCVRNLDNLRGVGILKTAGGLFDFLSKEKPRAPLWMQKSGFEWAFRVLHEPRRLLVRYMTTNPHAMFVILTSMR